MERTVLQVSPKGNAGVILFGHKTPQNEKASTDKGQSLLLEVTDRQDPQKIRMMSPKHQTARSEGRDLERQLYESLILIDQLKTQANSHGQLRNKYDEATQQLQKTRIQLKQYQDQNRQLRNRLYEFKNSVQCSNKESGCTELVRTERSQSGLINELEQYHKALQHTTQNLTDVLHTEISHLKETNNNQKIKIEELTKENHTLKQLNTSFSTADEGNLREQLKYIQAHNKQRLIAVQQEKQVLQDQLARKSYEIQKLTTSVKKDRIKEQSLFDTRLHELDSSKIEIELLRQELRIRTFQLQNSMQVIQQLHQDIAQLKNHLTRQTEKTCVGVSQYRLDEDETYLLRARKNLSRIRSSELDRLGSMIRSLRETTIATRPSWNIYSPE